MSSESIKLLIPPTSRMTKATTGAAQAVDQGKAGQELDLKPQLKIASNATERTVL